MNKTRIKLLMGAGIIGLAMLATGLFFLDWDKNENKKEEPDRDLNAVTSPLKINRPKEELPPFDPSKEAGWTVWGKVKRYKGGALEGAEVSLQLFDGEGFQPFLPAIKTDRKGRFITHVAAPEKIRACLPLAWLPVEIYGYAVLDGFGHGYDFITDVPYPLENQEPLRLDIVLKEGGVARGVLMDDHQKGISNASIYAIGPGANLWKEIAQTGTDGSYAFSLREGDACDLFALSPAKGVGGPVRIQLDDKGAGKAPPMGVKPFSKISGQILFPDKKPIPNLELEALPTELIDKDYSSLYDYAEGVLSRTNIPPDGIGFQGIPFGSARTDENGRFLISGLAPGDYFLWLPEYINDPKLRFACKAGQTNLQAVMELHLLEVVLVENNGRRVPMATLTLESDLLSEERDEIPCGHIIKQVKPGLIKLTAVAKDLVIGETRINIKEKDYLTKCQVLLTQRKQDAKIRLKVVDATGNELKPMPPIGAVFDGRLNSFQTPLTQDLRHKDGGYQLSVLPDQYQIMLMPAPDGKQEMDPYILPTMAPDVNAKSNEEIRVAVQLKKGGKLALTVNCPGVDKTPRNFYMILSHKQSGKEIRLRYFLGEEQEGAVTCRRMIPGNRYQHIKLLIPGAYQLKTSTKGFQDHLTEVEIKPSETNDLTLDLKPE